MLPLFGPSTTRDFGGLLFDNSVDIFGFNLLEFGGSFDVVDDNYRISMTASSIISKREGLIEVIDGVRKDSFDPYSTIRSAYLQRREAQINN
jgi:phospholipid-binding lipoprotein MlaA